MISPEDVDRALGYLYERWATVPQGSPLFPDPNKPSFPGQDSRKAREIIMELGRSGFIEGVRSRTALTTSGMQEVEEELLAPKEYLAKIREERRYVLQRLLDLELEGRRDPEDFGSLAERAGTLHRHFRYLKENGLLCAMWEGPLPTVTVEGKRWLVPPAWDAPSALRKSIDILSRLGNETPVQRSIAQKLTRVPQWQITRWEKKDPALVIRETGSPQLLMVGSLIRHLQERLESLGLQLRPQSRRIEQDI